MPSASWLQAPPLPSLTASRARSSPPFLHRLVVGGSNAAHFGCALGSQHHAGVLGKCEDSPAGGGQFLVLAEPGLAPLLTRESKNQPSHAESDRWRNTPTVVNRKLP